MTDASFWAFVPTALIGTYACILVILELRRCQRHANTWGHLMPYHLSLAPDFIRKLLNVSPWTAVVIVLLFVTSITISNIVAMHWFNLLSQIFVTLAFVMSLKEVHKEL